MKIIKRDGRQTAYNVAKIMNAINAACIATGEKVDLNIIVAIEDQIHELGTCSVEQIQDLIEKALKKENKAVYRAFSDYRRNREAIRLGKTGMMKEINQIGISTTRDNGNVGNNFSSKLLQIASTANKENNLNNMPQHLAKRHNERRIHIHDLDSYNLTTNCLHVPTGRILREGFNTGYGWITKPRRIETAALISCIIIQSCQNDQFGGVSHPDFDNDLAEYVDITRQEIIKDYSTFRNAVSEEVFNAAVEEKLNERVHQAMQAVVYNLNTMHSRAGSQVPFSGINIGLCMSKDAEIICQAFLEEFNKGMAKGEVLIFPNVAFAVKKGLNHPGDPQYYLFKLACEVASGKMNPTFLNMDSNITKPYTDEGIRVAIMGCRTYVASNVNGPKGSIARGNMAPVTMNLVRMGLEARVKFEDPSERIEHFYKLLQKELEYCEENLMHRYGVLKCLKTKDLPFNVGQHIIMGSEGLSENDNIEPVLKQGTWGIGYIGLAETMKAIFGKHHGESDEVYEQALEVVKYIRAFTDKLTEKYSLNFACYASPAEGLSGRFTPYDREIFGEIEGITDKEYYTNSFHVPVYYPISIKEKMKKEAPFHTLSNAGHISYIELDGYPTGSIIERLVLNTFNDNHDMDYLGINFHARFCKECGAKLQETEIACHDCGSHMIQGVSRITGYLALDERFNPNGKGAERRDRLSHAEGSIGNRIYINVEESK